LLIDIVIVNVILILMLIVLKVSKIILKLSKHQALVTKLITNGRKKALPFTLSLWILLPVSVWL